MKFYCHVCTVVMSGPPLFINFSKCRGKVPAQYFPVNRKALLY